MNNIIKIFVFGILVNKKRIIGWTIGIVAMMAIYMVFFPSVNDMASLKFDAMPEELLGLFGMENMTDLGNYSSYFGMIYQLVLIALSIYGGTFASAIIIGEEKNKSIEFLGALHVSRAEIYVSKYLLVTFSLLVVMILSTVTTIVCGISVGGETYSFNEIVRMSMVSTLVPLFFSGVALLLSGVNPKVGTGAVCGFAVLVSYLIGYLGQILGENGEFIRYFSPFEVIGPISVLEANSYLLIAIVIYGLVYISAVVVGGLFYNRRDFML